MVPGIAESILLVIEIGMKVFEYLGKDKGKKERSELKFFLERAKSILTAMKPVIERKKELVEGGMSENLKQLIQKVEEGNQLVGRIERSNKKLYKHHSEELQGWINSFHDSLFSALLRIFAVVVSNMEQRKQPLPPPVQTIQIHHYLHLCSFPAHQQFSIEEEDCKIAFGKFTDHGGLDRLFKGLESVSTHKTEDAKEQKELHVLQLPEIDKEQKLELMNTTEKTSMAVVPSTINVATHYQIPGSVDKHIVNMVDIEKPKTETRMLHFAASVCDLARKKLIERSPSCVKGVLNVKTVERPNQKELVIVTVTKDFVMKDFMNYLKKQFDPKYFEFIKEFPYEEEG